MAETQTTPTQTSLNDAQARVLRSIVRTNGRGGYSPKHHRHTIDALERRGLVEVTRNALGGVHKVRPTILGCGTGC